VNNRAAQRDRDDARADRERAAVYLAQAYRDDLTGALTRGPGRACLEREIGRARVACTPFTLAFTDVDGLKHVNDHSGHASGDRLLQAVGAALLNNLRPYDLVIRYGGDEFVCALIDSSVDLARRTMTRVQDQLAGHDPPARLSVGYADLRPDDSLDQLLRRADSAMYLTRTDPQRRGTPGTAAWPEMSCLPCDERMVVHIDTTSVLCATATCRACGHSIRLQLAASPARHTAHADETVITLPDRT
jgi:diguanylate cyclase (GGDEF)-like protein